MTEHELVNATFNYFVEIRSPVASILKVCVKSDLFMLLSFTSVEFYVGLCFGF